MCVRRRQGGGGWDTDILFVHARWVFFFWQSSFSVQFNVHDQVWLIWPICITIDILESLVIFTSSSFTDRRDWSNAFAFLAVLILFILVGRREAAAVRKNLFLSLVQIHKVGRRQHTMVFMFSQEHSYLHSWNGPC